MGATGRGRAARPSWSGRALLPLLEEEAQEVVVVLLRDGLGDVRGHGGERDRLAALQLALGNPHLLPLRIREDQDLPLLVQEEAAPEEVRLQDEDGRLERLVDVPARVEGVLEEAVEAPHADPV